MEAADSQQALCVDVPSQVVRTSGRRQDQNPLTTRWDVINRGKVRGRRDGLEIRLHNNAKAKS